MAEDSDAERTEPASGKRLEEARSKGQIPRSQELATFSILMVGVVALIKLGPELLQTLKTIFVTELTFNRATIADPNQMLLHFMSSSYKALMACLPIILPCALIAIITPVLVGGWLFTFDALAPNFSRMNPISGIGRMFTLKSVVNMVKTILKSSLIGGVAAWVLWSEREEFLQLITMPLEIGLPFMWDMVQHTLLLVISSLALLAAIDAPYQLWDYYKGLRMTKEEVKQEGKDAEGSAEVKGRIRQLQHEAARKRMMSEIPKANVIVTNPTHYAVALQYTEAMRAPKVVAKGAFLLAERIIELGKEHKVIVVRTPPFARALYHHAELGAEIPAALYTAAAEVLAYIYQLKHWQNYGGDEPNLADELPVPSELDPGSET
ncbi:flagellar biosynthesis protein FlhB [Janthinobacterium sp. B9-8]|uniref:flagellar biosynthesis protein FlhB n=1 Tax=Janthinobacterium sp. B9-8 TaxID=1236179 RepID=UPI00061CE0CD|nr:flagellar biosynthesis protein FlhB [Janthinobacterium sp. B9-8]AMC36850.1 flagellar biosynthetic protein FlhB [Janthinobacterium sp. B9-8]